jgi:hypothetical protein
MIIFGLTFGHVLDSRAVESSRALAERQVCSGAFQHRSSVQASGRGRMRSRWHPYPHILPATSHGFVVTCREELQVFPAMVIQKFRTGITRALLPRSRYDHFGFQIQDFAWPGANVR